ncbi:hypothetical protein [Rhodococcus sp. IEGM 1408]|uniref:hypothetical protein n=1 Tax=Rhodococcus sp. IEGM 1408 TaxID=3082220 RepID=UPI00295341AF|nr:hypothetical protein [Rhodococcus sp. IEGM 1408]MDV7999882.1 hypothetical protein [Rhodococcus sp. IEGM 1408]
MTDPGIGGGPPLTTAVHSGQRRHPAFGSAMLVLAAGLVLNSLLGPLGLGFVDYPISSTLQNQLIGLEIVTLALVAPLSIAAGVLALRGHRAAGPVAFGPAAYTAYMFAQYVLGPEYGEFNAVVLFDVGLFAAGAVLAVGAWAITDPRDLPVMSPRRQRAFGVVLLGLAAFVVSRYLGPVLGGPMPAEFADARTFFWSIVLLDLGLVVPAVICSAVALFLRSPSAPMALYAVIGWFVLVPPSVVSMAAVMVARSDSAGSVSQVVVLGIAAVVFLVFAAIVFRPLLSRRRAGASPG